MPDFRRKTNRLAPSNYIGPRSYLITLCILKRRRLFVSPDVVQPLIALLGELALLHAFDVYAYCFMPDHCHLLLCGRDRCSHLPRIVRSFKGRAAAHLRGFGYHNVWQTAYHDHVIRNDDDLRNGAAYILDNPVRAGLVRDPHDYPFSGSLVFVWQTATSL
ncbi:MAG TPA: transposase [Methylomirabilota bacterium]|nr:transposase [Methylomirabilota bacterium]